MTPIPARTSRWVTQRMVDELNAQDARAVADREAMAATDDCARAFREQFLKDTNLDVDLAMLRNAPIRQVQVDTVDGPMLQSVMVLNPVKRFFLVLWKRVKYAAHRLCGGRKKGWR